MFRGRFMARWAVAMVPAIGILGVSAIASAAADPVPIVVTGHRGSGRPALTLSGGELFLGWAGTTGAAATKQLMFARSVDRGVHTTNIANGERLPQGTGPALDGDFDGVYLGWPDGKAGNTLTVDLYNGIAFTCRTAFADVTTAYSPAIASDHLGHRYLAWTDPTGRLNVGLLDSSQCASTHTMRLTNRVALHDVTFTGPALAFDETSCCTDIPLGVMLGWVDRGGELRVATYDGTPVLKYRSKAVSPVKVAAAAPNLDTGSGVNLLSWRGVDGALYFAHTQGCRPACFQAPDARVADSGTGGISGIAGDAVSAWFDGQGRLTLRSSIFFPQAVGAT